MYGAILGDIIGAPFEFDRGSKSKDFPLFCEESQFTDDTVMTVAVAEALLDTQLQDDESIREALLRSLRKWGKKYPDAGYGLRFSNWLSMKHPKPYGSFGNGSAMRVSSAGWLFDSLEETRHIARLTAELTHNHPEGIKGAESVASAIFLARTGHGKDEIRDYICREFSYDLSRSCDEIRPGYRHVESCQQTVPEAITAFLEGEDFEDVIRTAVSLGGDCDTLTCIAASIAEAFYGMPDALMDECRSRLPEEMLHVLGRLDISRNYGQSRFPGDFLSGNCIVEDAIAAYYREGGMEKLTGVLNAFIQRMKADGQLLIPVIPPPAMLDMIDIDRVKPGDILTSPEDMHFKLHHIRTDDGKMWLAAFTSEKEQSRGESSSIISYFMDAFFEMCSDMPEEGIIINPWGQSFLLTKELIGLLLLYSREDAQ